MIERIIILENVDPLVFFGINNSNTQLLKTLFPKLRIVARGNVIKVIGEEEELTLFEEKIHELEKFSIEMNVLKERGLQHIIESVYKKSVAQKSKNKEEIINHVKEIYAPFSDEEISAKIAQMLTSKDIKAEVQIVFQSIEDLHKACPHHNGDWYFSGNYPTPGGNRLVNNAFINYIEGHEHVTRQYALNFNKTKND